MGQKKTAQNYLDNIPVIRDDRPWRLREDGVVEIDMENRGFYNKIAQKFFGKPKVSHITLDAYGSIVWQHIDGKNTVYEVVQTMQQHFPKEEDAMLKRVVTYMGTLERNGFIHMRGARI